MKYIVLCLAALTLGACNITTAQIQNAADRVRAASIVLCSFAPAIDAVREIIRNEPDPLATDHSIAAKICTAVTASVGPTQAYAMAISAQKKKRAAPPTVNGVVVRGQFVRRKRK